MMVVGVLLVGAIFFYRALLAQSKTPSGKLGAGLMKLWNRVYLPMVRWSLRVVQPQQVKTILDVGIGNGASTNYLAQQYPAAKVTGIDISETGIQLAQKQFALSGIDFAVANVENLSYSPESFDLITVYQNHFYWENLAQGLSELRRLLSPDGKMIISCETTKVNYYLKEFTDANNFKNYLQELGLTLRATKNYRGWLLYEVEAANVN